MGVPNSTLRLIGHMFVRWAQTLSAGTVDQWGSCFHQCGLRVHCYAERDSLRPCSVLHPWLMMGIMSPVWVQWPMSLAGSRYLLCRCYGLGPCLGLGGWRCRRSYFPSRLEHSHKGCRYLFSLLPRLCDPGFHANLALSTVFCFLFNRGPGCFLKQKVPSCFHGVKI